MWRWRYNSNRFNLLSSWKKNKFHNVSYKENSLWALVVWWVPWKLMEVALLDQMWMKKQRPRHAHARLDLEWIPWIFLRSSEWNFHSILKQFYSKLTLDSFTYIQNMCNRLAWPDHRTERHDWSLLIQSREFLGKLCSKMKNVKWTHLQFHQILLQARFHSKIDKLALPKNFALGGRELCSKWIRFEGAWRFKRVYFTQHSSYEPVFTINPYM